MTNAPRLEHGDVALEPVAEGHGPALFPLMADPELTRYLNWAPHTAESETCQLLRNLAAANAAGEAVHWTLMSACTPIGIVSLIDLTWRHRHWELDRGELAYWVGRPYQGQGYATRAARLATRYALAALGLHKVRIAHATANPASGRIPEKLGFREIGVELDAFKKDGVWNNLRHYEFLAAWLAELG